MQGLKIGYSLMYTDEAETRVRHGKTRHESRYIQNVRCHLVSGHVGRQDK